MKKAFKFIAYTIGCIAIVFIGLIVCAFWTSDYESTLHTAKIDWLPASSSDVSHKFRTGMGATELIECAMPEKDFLALAKDKKWLIEPKSDFSAHMRIEGLPPLRTLDGFGPVDIVVRGYKYELRHGNGGGITVCYDSDLNRMIYATSHR